MHTNLVNVHPDDIEMAELPPRLRSLAKYTPRAAAALKVHRYLETAEALRSFADERLADADACGEAGWPEEVVEFRRLAKAAGEVAQ